MKGEAATDTGLLPTGLQRESSRRASGPQPSLLPIRQTSSPFPEPFLSSATCAGRRDSAL